MKRVYIIHGWEGYPEEGWFPWLKTELTLRDFDVSVPTMPETDAPKIEQWLPYLHEVIGAPDEQTYLIGHSMGARAIMHYVSQLPDNVRLGGVISVAGAFILRNLNDEETAILQPWLELPLDAQKILSSTTNIVAIFSDNDPWIPLAENQHFFEDQFQAQTYVLRHQGHFSGSDGIKELPIVLESILKLVGITTDR